MSTSHIEAIASTQSKGLRAFFLSGKRGPLFALHYTPEAACKRNILVLPSFCEEMNRCRSMIAMQARRLAQQGIGTLVLDAYGTGDSAGEFAELTWQDWLEDMSSGYDWLRAQPGGCDTLWAVRSGALMLEPLLARYADVRRLVLWQPVLNGKNFFNQFLRIRVAADIENPHGVKKTDDLQKLFAAGESVEISGYEVSPQLAAGIDAANFPAAEQLAGKTIAWYEVVADATLGIARNNQLMIERLQAAGRAVTVEKLAGALFWQVHERAVVPELLDATERDLAAWS